MELAWLVEAHQGPAEEPSALEGVTELFSVAFDRWKDFPDFPFSPSISEASGVQHPSEARDVLMGKLGTGIQLQDTEQGGSDGISKGRVCDIPHCSNCNPPHPSLPQTATSIFPKPYFGGAYFPPLTRLSLWEGVGGCPARQ